MDGLIALIVGAAMTFGILRFAAWLSNARQRGSQLANILLGAVVVMTACSWLYLVATGTPPSRYSSSYSRSSVIIPTPLPIQHEDLQIDTTTTYRLDAGDILSLRYTGETNERLSISIEVDNGGIPPILNVFSGTVDNRTSFATYPRLDSTRLCGYVLESDGRVYFSIHVASTGDYSVTVERGATCTTHAN